MKSHTLVSTSVCIDLFGPIFLGQNVFGNSFERIFQITQITDPRNIFVFCGDPKKEQKVRLLLEISDFFQKTGILPECLIFSEKRPDEDFMVIISSDFKSLRDIVKRTLRILIGCDPEEMKDFRKNVLSKLSYGEAPKWDTLLTVSDWDQNFSIIMSWIENPEKVLVIPIQKSL